MNRTITALLMFLTSLGGYSQTSQEFFASGSNKHNAKDYKGAIEDYDKAIALEPKIDMYIYNRGMAEFCLENYTEAIKDYTKALSVSYNKDFVYHLRGNAESKQKNYKGAIEDFNKAITINPDYYFAFISRAATKDLIKDYKGAIEDFTRAQAIHPDEKEPILLRANSKQHLKDYKGALLDYAKFIEMRGSVDQIYYDRGICKIALNQKEEGCKDLNYASRWDEDKAKVQEAIKKYCK